MNKPLSEHPKLLLDPYAHLGRRRKACRSPRISASICSKVPTAPWPRFGVDGAIVHLKGRGDFVSIFVLDLAPGAQTTPQKHLYEEVVYVLSGYGSTTVETSDGRKHSFEWGPKSLFALPLNARYQHFNTSGRERARLASTNNLCLHAQPLPQRGIRLRQHVRVPRAAGRGRRISAAKASSCRCGPAATCGRRTSSPISRRSSSRPGRSAAPAAPT